MSEREMRDVLRRVCSDLDGSLRSRVARGVRKVVVPAVAAVGLIASMPACEYGVPDEDALGDVSEDTQVSDPGPQPAYMAPAPDASEQDIEPPNVPAYGVPIP